MANVISDDFNRADSNTVGGGWTEAGSSADDERISSNALALGTGSSNTNASVYQNLGASPTKPINMSLKFKTTNNARGLYIYPYFSSSGATSFTGIGLYVRNGAMNIVNNQTTVGSSGTPTIANNTDYYVWIDITANGSNVDIAAYLSTTNTKPGSPTITATNISPTNSTGQHCRLIVDATNNGIWTIDDVVISTSYSIGRIIASIVQGNTGAASLTYAFDSLVSQKRSLIVYVTLQNTSGDSLTGVTYGGQAMTFLGKVSQVSGGFGTTYAYGLINPPTGSNNVVISRSNSTGTINSTAVCYAWTNQTTIPDAVASNINGTGSGNLTTSITTIAASCGVSGFGTMDNGSYGAGTGATLLSNVTQSCGTLESTTFPIVSPSSYSMQQVGSAGSWATMILVSISPYIPIITATFTEIVAHSDTIRKSTMRSLLETISHTGTFSSSKVLVKNLIETIAHTDTILRNITRSLIETVTNTATFSKIQSIVRQYTESVSHTDTIVNIRIMNKYFTETMSFIDDIIIQINGIVTNFWSKIARGDDNDDDWTKTPSN